MTNLSKRLIWATDVHFNHVDVAHWDLWIDSLRQSISVGKNDASGLILTGDISESDDVIFQLRRLAESISVPIYFVLGNHDFYQGSVARTRAEVIGATRSDSQVHYLTDASAIELDSSTYLLGEDGWGDGTIGDYENSPIRLNDFVLIEEFRKRSADHWHLMLRELGRDSAERLRDKLLAIPKDARDVIVATHVPPYRESCWYEGKISDDDWAPFFVCGQVGEVLRWYSRRRPEQCITVLCGHTHHDGIAKMADNLIVHTGNAVYGRPAVYAHLEISDGVSVKPIG